MSWEYEVDTGTVVTPQNEILTTVGYSGNGSSMNLQTAEDVEGHGPIPKGKYRMGPWFNDPEKGPVVTRLIPDPDNEMFGRSGFMVHGDNPSMNHTASDGCIILPRFARLAMSTSPDQQLEVI